MQELEVNSIKYRTGQKLNAFDQFHVFRKLAPLFSGMGETFNKLPESPDGQQIPPGFWQALEPAANALAQMSREDSEFVIKTCLQNCTRLNEAGHWARVTTPDGALMFEDMDLMVVLRLAWVVIQENLGGFFEGPVPNGSADEGTFQLSSLPR